MRYNTEVWYRFENTHHGFMKENGPIHDLLMRILLCGTNREVAPAPRGILTHMEYACSMPHRVFFETAHFGTHRRYETFDHSFDDPPSCLLCDTHRDVAPALRGALTHMT